MKYNVKHAFNISQPKWTKNYSHRFGDRNQGFEIEAENLESVKGRLKSEYNLNPFYLTIDAIKS